MQYFWKPGGHKTDFVERCKSQVALVAACSAVVCDHKFSKRENDGILNLSELQIYKKIFTK